MVQRQTTYKTLQPNCKLMTYHRLLLQTWVSFTGFITKLLQYTETVLPSSRAKLQTFQDPSYHRSPNRQIPVNPLLWIIVDFQSKKTCWLMIVEDYTTQSWALHKLTTDLTYRKPTIIISPWGGSQYLLASNLQKRKANGGTVTYHQSILRYGYLSSSSKCAIWRFLEIGVPQIIL